MTDPIARVCGVCGAYQSYPRPVCTVCHGKVFTLFATPATGTIYSMTTVHRAPDAEQAADIPYVVALVQGPQGGLLMLRLRDFPAHAAPAHGETVRIDIDPAPHSSGLAAYPASSQRTLS